MKTWKNLVLAAIIAIFGIVGFIGCDNSESDPQPDGSADNPFTISTAAALQKLGSGTDGWGMDKHYKLTADINLSGVDWTSIGTFNGGGSYTFFSGTFDGGGKTISNFSHTDGLFTGLGAGGIIKNVKLTNVNIVDNDELAGSLVSWNVGGTVQNCYVEGSVSSEGEHDGAIVGGVVGENVAGTVENCYFKGSITAIYTPGNNIPTPSGGVVGLNTSPTETSGYPIIGIAKVQNCYAIGTVSGTTSSGGVIGRNSYGGELVYNCVALNDSITIDGQVIGRVLSYSTGTINNCYARSDMTLTKDTGTYTPISGKDKPDGENITATQYNSQTWWSDTVGFDFSTSGAWAWDSSLNLPVLK